MIPMTDISLTTVEFTIDIYCTQKTCSQA